MRPAMTILCGLILVALALGAPFVLKTYDLRLTNLALISAVSVLGLCAAFGWCGLIQLGQAALMGVGGYASAIIALRTGWSFWITMPIAVVITALVALVIAVPLLRLRGHYLALATVGLNVTGVVILRNWIALTGGYDGLSGIPPVSLFGHALRRESEFYWLHLGVLAVAALLVLALRTSYYGRAMIAVQNDELAAGASGISVVRTKVLAFVVSAVLAAVSGALYAHYSRYLAPQDFELARSVTLLVMLIVGGSMSVLGSICGAILLTFAPEWLRFIGDAYLAVFGVGVVLVLILMPDGLAGRMKRLLGRMPAGQPVHV